MDESIKHTIYKITNLVNGKIYIGLTKHSLESRMKSHITAANLTSLKPTRNKSRVLMRAIVKHGSDNFIIESIDTASSRFEAGEKEKYWIEKLDARGDNGYNMTDGGEGICGYSLSDSHKKTLSENNSGENNYFYGKCGKDSMHYGKSLSEEHKELLKVNNANNVPVVINGVTYRSKNSAAEILGVSKTSVNSLIDWKESLKNFEPDRLLIDGVRYFGLKTAAKALGTSAYLLGRKIDDSNYVKSEWTFDEFLEYTKSLKKSIKPVEIEGKIFKSIKEAARSIGCDADVILRMIRDGKASYSDVKIYTPSHNSKPIEFCGEVFESKTRLMDYYKISNKEFNRLLESGEVKEVL